MEENPFFTIEQPNISIMPALLKLDNRTPNKFMAILWNLGGYSISIKRNRNTTINYMKESDYIKQIITASPILTYLDPDKSITFLQIATNAPSVEF